MAAQSPPPSWPLQNPIKSPPPSSPPPSYHTRDGSKDNGSTSSHPRDMPKRRPLSSSQGNAYGGSQGRGPSPLHGVANMGPPQVPVLARKSSFESGDDAFMRGQTNQSVSPQLQAEFEARHARRKSSDTMPVTQTLTSRPHLTYTESAPNIQQPQTAIISSGNSPSSSRHTSAGSWSHIMSQAGEESQMSPQPLQYHHQLFQTNHGRKPSHDRTLSADNIPPLTQVRRVSADSAPPVPQHGGRLTPSSAHLGANLPRPSSGYSLPRPVSSYSTASEGGPGRSLPPGSPNARTPSPSRASPDNRPMSFIDLLNVPYPQPPPAPTSLDNTLLQASVGQNATLLNTKKTLEMYRMNAKKTNDPTIQYEFAVFMVNAAADVANEGASNAGASSPNSERADLLREARQLLLKLSDRSYPFAQYYLADGFASGLFNKGTPDNDRAFPLFVAASKHGHAEAGYRAALCYEFGWGCRKDPQKAVQFYRQSASKNHPGAMSRLGRACLMGDLGLVNRYREGLKWLKRAAESADFQYNSAPYELGLLHETGYGDDIFQDPSYSAQLFTQSADLGHVDANYRLGDAYEHGKLSCPKDPALSVHFYTGAATRGHPLAQMALCAWYMVGAEPVLDKDENEAFEWAKQAAESGMSFSSHPRVGATANTTPQVSQRQSTQSATSRRWASEPAGIPSKPTSGMSGQLIKGTRGPSTGSLLSELLRRGMEITPQRAVGCLHRAWMMTVRKGEVERRKGRRNGDCFDRDDRAPWSRESSCGTSFSSALSMHCIGSKGGFNG